MANELTSDYYKAKEILATVVEFSQTTPESTEYDFSNDTWYVNEDGETVEISKNTLLFNSVDTYKGLILNYYRLKDKYKDKFHSDMWAILIYFEELVAKTNLTTEERFVVDKIMHDFTRKEITDEFEKEFSKTLTMRTLSNWINRIIPNKILNTYLTSMDNWLYTYKMKGKFKQCSECKEVKLIVNNRYFTKNRLSKDGYYSICNSCRNT